MDNQWTILEQLQKISNDIKLNLDILQNDIDILKCNILELNKLKKSLTENRKFLKKQHVVIIASEYKKIVKELNLVKTTIEKYSLLLENTEQRKFKEQLQATVVGEKIKEVQEDISTHRTVIPFKKKNESKRQKRITKKNSQ